MTNTHGNTSDIWEKKILWECDIWLTQATWKWIHNSYTFKKNNQKTSQITPKHLQHLCLSSSHACLDWKLHKNRIRKSLNQCYWPLQHLLHMQTVWPLATPTSPAVTELDRVSWVGSTLVSNSLVPGLLSRLNLSGLACSWLMQIQPIC